MAQRIPRPNFQGVSPVILSSSCDVLSNNSAIPNSGELAYPFRKAVIIEEIRFDLRMVTSDELNLGALVYAKLMLGHHYLMRDAVPIWLLGTSMAMSQEENNDSDLATPATYSHYRWRLPEPLYVEAGQFISSVFTRKNDTLASINVQVSYVGHTVAPNQPRPPSVSIPYVAPFVTNAGQAYQQSNENHLFNPFNQPLRIQRLTGRLAIAPANAYRAVTPAPANPSEPKITVLMDDSWGGKMVNNNTGPSDVFDILRSSWTVDTEMPPKGVYELRVWNINSLFRLHVAMIGLREERL